MIKVCVCVCVYETRSICVHINICSLSWFNSPLQHLRSNPCLCLWETVSCTDVFVFCFQSTMIGGEFVVPREEVFSPRGEEQERRAERGYSPPPALNPRFKICDLCAVEGVNTHTNTRCLFSFPLLSGQGDKL